MDNKYKYLISVLDQFCNEAPEAYKRYDLNSPKTNIENARSRAFIHLFLKVKFGLISFEEREYLITDGPGDGGIDAYYIDSENKKLYIIQSKFRNTDQNFITKEIMLDELLNMDIEQITDGNTVNEDGERYNGKICQFISDLQQVSDLPKYQTKIIILANVNSKHKQKLKKITGGYNVDIYNHERIYSELLFPLISGSYFNPTELKITLNVDKESAGHRIQYYPLTQYGDCTVNALYVPTIEIAKILWKYKNSILKFNPRSYLDLASSSINKKIAGSILNLQTNEFALFNNGITMLSDETIYSDKVGKKNKAEIIVLNPQIINGGQTAYTLSILYAQNQNNIDIFNNKEVLLKIISFNTEDGDNVSLNNKLKLIEEISIATNQQSPVNEADRRANDKVQIELQKHIFQDFGLFYERKRGEFGDGIRAGYINRQNIIDREQFLRICLAIKNDPVKARSGTAHLLFEKNRFDAILPDASEYRKYIYGYRAYEQIGKLPNVSYNAKTYARFAIVNVLISLYYDENLPLHKYDEDLTTHLNILIEKWDDFETYVRNADHNKKYYFKEVFDKATGERTIETNWTAYYKGRTLISDISAFFFKQNDSN